ncbi:hypothetical protein LMG31884_22910 [Xanthomonas hydrangeae]|nr:hypothetical protein LMG31884_22910 [Xanthomonas hydrangeae]CAD7716693.1 hypothetical protein LMG31884_22910 [Xanthomonas hydrangeae]CAD7732358.1 hypothetical protein LMG31887_22800 [Xanthomonas hydrangeae]CAD7732361.1 hypothetical protein LMG31887_22800 [Xanthomonas hydrangeae]
MSDLSLLDHVSPLNRWLFCYAFLLGTGLIAMTAASRRIR